MPRGACVSTVCLYNVSFVLKLLLHLPQLNLNFFRAVCCVLQPYDCLDKQAWPTEPRLIQFKAAKVVLAGQTSIAIRMACKFRYGASTHDSKLAVKI